MNALVRTQLLTVVVLLIGGPLVLRAQTQQDVPTIEPTYTRIFGSDTLEIGSPAMSPDGRWIAFAVLESMDKMNLWIVSSEGGEPIRLTDGNYSDEAPVWFPNSDRIAFRSVARRPYLAIMTLLIDPRTGQRAGPPQTVTLEASAAYFDVSPDGRWIAYTPIDDQGYRVIRVIPSTGGTARTLTRADTPTPVWGPDGRNIYYVLNAGGSGETFMRVAVDGGQPDTVFTWPGRIRYKPGPNRRFVLRAVSSGSPEFELATLDGRAIGRLTLPQGMTPREIIAGNQLLALKSETATPLRILPVTGGPARQLVDGNVHRVPLGWTKDGLVFFETELNGDDVLLLAPDDGRAMRQVRLPEQRMAVPESRMAEYAPVLSADGRHLLYAVSGDDPEVSTLKVLSLEDARSSEVTEAHATDESGTVLGRGGTPRRDGEDFLYVESRGDVRELRASSPEGQSRALWNSAAEEWPTAVTVHGDRIAFARNFEAGATLHLATAGDSKSRDILRLPGWLSAAAWSHDGTWIAAVHTDTLKMGEGRERIMFVRVSSDGEVVGQPRFVGDKMLAWWSLQWLPDNRGILATGFDANVWLLPVDPDANPVCLTRDDPDRSWNFVVSPDGRHIVYHVQVPRGSSIWKVDLGEIPEPTRR